MKGTELEIGQNVLYFHNGPGGFVCEDAEIIVVRSRSIRVEFSGSLSYGKKKGDQSNIFNTTGKIFILDKEKRINGLIEQVKDLTVENEKLREEVEKIYSRFEIIDL